MKQDIQSGKISRVGLDFSIRNRSLIIRVEIEKGLMMSAEKKIDFRGVECLEERLQRLFLRNKLTCTNDSCTARLRKSIRKTNRVLTFSWGMKEQALSNKVFLWELSFQNSTQCANGFRKDWHIDEHTLWVHHEKDVTETQSCPFPQTSLSLPLFAVPWCTKNPLFLSRVSQRNGIEALLWSSVRQRGFPPPGKSADQMRTVTH